MPRPHDVLHVPLFFHQMSGMRGSPVFQSAPLNPGQVYEMTFTIPGIYDYICGVHGPSMAGRIRVDTAGPALVDVQATGSNTFVPADATVGVGGKVRWTNTGGTQHSVVETGGANRPSLCFNGRAFIGNTPTIVAARRPADPLVRVQPRPRHGLAQLPPSRAAVAVRRRERRRPQHRPGRVVRRRDRCAAGPAAPAGDREGPAPEAPAEEREGVRLAATSSSTATSRCT